MIAENYKIFSKNKIGKSRGFYINSGDCWLIAIPLLFVLLSLIHLDKPGIHYDEILFGNAALGGIDGSFITKRFGDFPVMLMPYVGAFKAYIYYPIFKIFPVSAYTIRIPAIILGALTLFFTFKYVNLIFDKKTAFVAILLLAFDPSFLFQNKLFGVSISLFLKSLALFFLIKGIKTGGKSFFIFSFLCLGLGVFDKLDFIWFATALFLAAFIVFYNEAISVFKKNIKLSAAVLMPIFVSFYLLFIYVLRMSLTLFHEGFFTFNLLERLKYQFVNFKDTLGGNAAYYMMTNMDLPFQSLLLPIGILMVLLVFPIHLFLKIKVFNKWMVFFVVVLIIILFQIYATAKATGSHHMIMIYPFPHLIIAFFIGKIIESLQKSHLKSAITAVVYAAVGIVIIFNLYVNFQYINAFKHDNTSVFWSAGIYNLINYVKNNKEKTYVSMDWGFHNQLLAFTKGTAKLRESFGGFNNFDPGKDKDIAEIEPWLIKHICEPNAVFLFHTDSDSFFIKAKRNFFYLLSKYNLDSKLTMKLGNGKKDYYELYEIDPKNCINRGI
ncbi:MAG: glycosyltransferase family 39 protein [Nitrospirae bacterium]|nr:glycosyltransferase family 39 protein [Nitrospirota bacterium]